MLISKFNVYKDEWLDLVFDDRNKSYGAYELRQHYPQGMVKAMVVALTAVSAVAIVFGVILRPAVTKASVDRFIQVTIKPYVVPHKVDLPKPVKPHFVAPKPPAAPVQPATATAKFIPMVVKPDVDAQNPPAITELVDKNIGSADIKGPSAPGAIDPGKTDGPGGPGPATDNSVHPADGLERMPEPYGGAAAWSKFLQKHLNYPQQALEGSMQGRVLVSFIIEKDGHLSNITVSRGAGYGMDEEALRVLKLAPAWKPGIQNGQPVRVAYTIPINFLLGDND